MRQSEVLLELGAVIAGVRLMVVNLREQNLDGDAVRVRIADGSVGVCVEMGARVADWGDE